MTVLRFKKNTKLSLSIKFVPTFTVTHQQDEFYMVEFQIHAQNNSELILQMDKELCEVTNDFS